MSGPIWKGLDHHQIYQAVVHEGAGPGVSMDAEEAWARIGPLISHIDTRISTAIRATEQDWAGGSADAAREGISTLSRWALDAAGDAASTAAAVLDQARHAGEVRRYMRDIPPPQHTPLDDVAAGISDILDGSTPRKLTEQATAAEAVVRLMDSYSNASYTHQRLLDYWTIPPTVTVAAAIPGPTGPPGGAAGPAGFGTGLGDPGAPRGAPADLPTAFAGGAAGPGGPVAVGPGGAITDALVGPGAGGPSGSGPAGPGVGGAGSGVGGAGSGGPGVGGSGIGGTGGTGAGGPGSGSIGSGSPGTGSTGTGSTGSGSPGSGSAGSGSTGTGSTGTGSTGTGSPGAGGPGSGGAGWGGVGGPGSGGVAGRPSAGLAGSGSPGGAGPAGVPAGPGATGPGVRDGAGTAGPGNRSIGSPTGTVPGIGSWGTPRDAPAAGGRGTGPGPWSRTTPDPNTFRPIVPGVVPTPPPPTWRSILSTPDPDGGLPRESGRAATGTTEPTARGTRPTATPVGHGGLYPPMTTGAGAGQDREHRRPPYLLDDSGAFEVDVYYVDPVIRGDPDLDR